MRRLLITGDTGLLGSSIAAEAVAQFDVLGVSRLRTVASFGWNHRSLDLLDEDSVSGLLEDIRPHIIVHCAAATDVDQCDRDRARTHVLNVGATEQLARWAGQNGTQFAYISTDSVFDGIRGGYREEDSPRPLNEYARSKAEGEKAALRASPGALVVRTNFFGWNRGAKPNLGRWMYERHVRDESLPAFSDVRFSPLFAQDLARLILEMISCEAKDIFHVAARDSCTKLEFALFLGRAIRLDITNVRPILLDDIVFEARRPRNTSLCVEKCEQFLGKRMPSVQEGIIHFVEALEASRFAQPFGENEVERRPALDAR